MTDHEAGAQRQVPASRTDRPDGRPEQGVELPSGPRAGDSGGGTEGVLGRLGTRGLAASRYRLRGEIARGGMGAILEVFDQDLRRRLAMKVILDPRSGEAGTDAASVPPALLARFLEEAQVTGQLDHPGIVPVHELGLDERGQVYFTMRLVQGRDLESIFDLAAREEEDWTRARAVGALLKVCEAMAFAHSKGVVHRDLKPGNVMVGRFGEVYVMDWGLARVRDREDRHDLRVRPPSEEASPESPRGPRGSAGAFPPSPEAGAETVAGSPDGVETDRRDAAASGAKDALHTLDGSIVGTPCYMPPEQARGQVAELDERSDVYAVGAMLYRLLAGVAPYATRAGMPPATTVLLAVLHGPPEPLEAVAPDAPAELAAICSRAMARERAERYPDMQALAADLRAFLEGRVVGAFEAGAWAEARKWMRRNRALSATAAALLVALIAGLATSLVFADRAQRSTVLAEERREEAQASAASARREAAIAEESNAFLNEDLLAAVSPEAGGIDVTVREVLDQAALRLDGRFAAEPAVEAALRTTIGKSYASLGEYETARKHLERALELRRASEVPAGAGTVEALGELATALSRLGRGQEALALYEQALALATEVLGAEDRTTLSLQTDLALVHHAAGRDGESRAILERILPLQERILGADHADTLVSLNNFALLEQAAGRLEDAAARLQRVLDARRRTLGAEHPETLTAASNVASVHADLGRFDESVALSRELLAVRRRLLGPTHPLVAQEQENLGTFLFRAGNAREALVQYEEAVALHRRRFGEEHPATLRARHNLAAGTLEQGRAREALELELPVLEARRRILGAEHVDTLMSANTLAVAFQRLDDFGAAEPRFRELLEIRVRTQGALHPDALIARENLAGLLFAAARHEEAEALVREVLDGRRTALGASHPDTAKTLYNLAQVQKGRGRSAEARATLDEALERLRASLGDGNVLVAEALRTRGDLELGAGLPGDAVDAFHEALEVRRALGADGEAEGYLLHQIGVAHLALAEPEAALEALEEAADLRERLLGADAAATRITQFTRAGALARLERFQEAEALALDFLERTQRVDAANEDHLRRGRALLVEITTASGRPADAERRR